MKKPLPLAVGAILFFAVLSFSAFLFIRDANTPAHQAPVGRAPTQTITLADGDRYALRLQTITTTIADLPMELVGYNGSIPGPVIRVKQGSRLSVVVENGLAEPTTLHPHGVRASMQADGVPGITQEPIQPGESFTHEMTFPDAGVFWYHPHLNAAKQLHHGAFGFFIVEPTTGDSWNRVGQEIPLAFHDLLVQNGRLVPFPKDTVSHTLMGRYGNLLLTNGTPNFPIEGRAGETLRLFLLNAANARPLRITIPGLTMKRIGSDQGPAIQESILETLDLSPSERAIVEITLPAQPGILVIQHAPPTGSRTDLATIRIAPPSNPATGTTSTLRTYPAVTASIEPFKEALALPPQKTLTIGLEMPSGPMMHGGHAMPSMNMGDANTDGVEWEDTMGAMNQGMMANHLTWTLQDTQTGKTNEAIDWTFPKGTQLMLRVQNPNTGMHPMQHPFHIHGQRFLVARVNGVPVAPDTWKDTVNIPAGTTMDLLVDLSNPGTWMMHCHIAEHLETGMMLHFTVTDTR